MEELQRFVRNITVDLPLSEAEKEELREEMLQHLEDHVQELLVKGYSEGEALEEAMQSFGNHQAINSQLKRVYFPFFQLFRYVWSVIITSVCLGFFSYSIMEYYHPEFDNSVPMSSYLGGLFLVAVVAAFAEAIYTAIQVKPKWQWVKNPWVFFGVPALIIGGSMGIQLFGEMERYPEWYWVDYFVVPITTVPYLVSRQLFEGIFSSRKKMRGMRT